jgi:serine phosphatase RsbU (regulator of sigma subunit)
MSIIAMHTLIRMLPDDLYRDTARFVAEINQRLCENSIVQNGEGFITLFYAALDTVDHTMTWTSAGHPPALVHRRDINKVMPIGLDSDGGVPLGIAPGMDYPSKTYSIPPGSRLLIYSDGLADAFPVERDGCPIFGVRGITQTLQACRSHNLEHTLDQLFQASHGCTGGQGRHDGTSVLLVERQEYELPSGECFSWSAV